MLNKIGMSSYIVNCDGAVYEICKEIQWKTKSEFDDMAFRLGCFHIAKNFLGVIGKRMDGSGFSEILEDTSSEVPPRLKVMCNSSFQENCHSFLVIIHIVSQ